MNSAALARIGPALFLAIAILVVWQVGVTVSGMPQFILPSPLAIIGVIAKAAPLLLRNSVATLEEFGFGLGASILCGVALGVATAKSRTFEVVPVHWTGIGLS